MESVSVSRNFLLVFSKLHETTLMDNDILQKVLITVTSFVAVV